jgi:hypothetical protein
MIFPPIGKEFWSIDNGHKYEVSKITNGYVYLTRYDGNCSHVRHINKERWESQREFVDSSKEAWHTLLCSDVDNAKAELASKERLLDSFRKEHGIII